MTKARIYLIIFITVKTLTLFSYLKTSLKMQLLHFGILPKSRSEICLLQPVGRSANSVYFIIKNI